MWVWGRIGIKDRMPMKQKWIICLLQLRNDTEQCFLYWDMYIQRSIDIFLEGADFKLFLSASEMYV